MMLSPRERIQAFHERAAQMSKDEIVHEYAARIEVDAWRELALDKPKSTEPEGGITLKGFGLEGRTAGILGIIALVVVILAGALGGVVWHTAQGFEAIKQQHADGLDALSCLTYAFAGPDLRKLMVRPKCLHGEAH